jgi:DNA modification methylase
MRWLVRLVTPINGTVLDPFTGSGTTGMACRYEQRGFVGIEREAEYVEIAMRRIAAVAPLFSEQLPQTLPMGESA